MKSRPFPGGADLEDQLKARYPFLRELRVVDPGMKDLDSIQKTVAREAAYYLEEIAWKGAKIGLSGGKTLYYMINYLEPERLSGLHLYPLTLTPILTMPGLTANAMVGMMSTKYPDATAYNLPTIPVTSKEEYEKQMAANPEMLKIYRDIWKVDIMVLGIGYLTGPLPGFRALASQEMGLTAEDLAAKGVVGEINHTPIDAQGEPILESQGPGTRGPDPAGHRRGGPGTQGAGGYGQPLRGGGGRGPGEDRGHPGLP